MATWTDGAAYAPIERPDGFAMPKASPLAPASRFDAGTPGPIPPPHGFQPSAPAPALDQLHVAPRATRNPAQPYAVSNALLTAGSSLREAGAPRDPKRAFTVASSAADALPPPVGDPLPPPVGPPLAEPGMLPPGAYPPPGEAPMWGAGATPQTNSTQRVLVLLAVAALLLGLMIPPASPWLMVMAGLMTLRTQSITGSMHSWALGIGLVLGIYNGVASGAGDLTPVAMIATICFALFAISQWIRTRS